MTMTPVTTPAESPTRRWTPTREQVQHLPVVVPLLVALQYPDQSWELRATSFILTALIAMALLHIGERRAEARLTMLRVISCLLIALGATGVLSLRHEVGTSNQLSVPTAVEAGTELRESERVTACESSLQNVIGNLYQAGIAGVPAQTPRGPITGSDRDRLADCQQKMRNLSAVLGG